MNIEYDRRYEAVMDKLFLLDVSKFTPHDVETIKIALQYKHNDEVQMAELRREMEQMKTERGVHEDDSRKRL